MYGGRSVYHFKKNLPLNSYKKMKKWVHDCEKRACGDSLSEWRKKFFFHMTSCIYFQRLRHVKQRVLIFYPHVYSTYICVCVITFMLRLRFIRLIVIWLKFWINSELWNDEVWASIKLVRGIDLPSFSLHNITIITTISYF